MRHTEHPESYRIDDFVRLFSNGTEKCRGESDSGTHINTILLYYYYDNIKMCPVANVRDLIS